MPMVREPNKAYKLVSSLSSSRLVQIPMVDGGGCLSLSLTSDASVHSMDFLRSPDFYDTYNSFALEDSIFKNCEYK